MRGVLCLNFFLANFSAHPVNNKIKKGYWNRTIGLRIPFLKIGILGLGRIGKGLAGKLLKIGCMPILFT